MSKITFNEVNVLQGFHTYYREAYTEVYEQLKDASDHVYVGWQTNVDDPYDVTFCVGARDTALLHDFIVKYAGVLSKLSPDAERVIKEFYTHKDENFTIIAAPKGATPVDYKVLDQIVKGPERNSSWWYDCAYQKVVTKREVIDSQAEFAFHKFVKVRD